MLQIFPPILFTGERPHYSLALFSNFICTCTTLICIQKDPRLLSEKISEYANAAEKVKTMSVAPFFSSLGTQK